MKAFPWLVTGVWLIVVGAGMYHHGRDVLLNLSLNEWGDFLAGAFAPLAFFWFILAYFLQQQEIRNQVAETSRLADHSKMQADYTLLAQKREDLKLAMSVKPGFVNRGCGGGANHSVVNLENQGERARGLWASSENTFVSSIDFTHTEVDKSSHTQVILSFRSDEKKFPIPFTVKCRDNLDYLHHIDFVLKEEFSAEGPLDHRIYKPLPDGSVLELTHPVRP